MKNLGQSIQARMAETLGSNPMLIATKLQGPFRYGRIRETFTLPFSDSFATNGLRWKGGVIHKYTGPCAKCWGFREEHNTDTFVLPGGSYR